jgi:hypothetical protein
MQMIETSSKSGINKTAENHKKAKKLNLSCFTSVWTDPRVVFSEMIISAEKTFRGQPHLTSSNKYKKTLLWTNKQKVRNYSFVSFEQ